MVKGLEHSWFLGGHETPLEVSFIGRYGIMLYIWNLV